MEFWHDHMPDGMILRSRLRSSSISDPERALTISSFPGMPTDRMANATLAAFLDYAHWFQHEAVPSVDNRKVANVEALGKAFRLTLEDGEIVDVQRVVVAAGLAPFARRPAWLDGLPAELVSHTSDHKKLSVFAGLEIVVVGAGQSALESAALLTEAGAHVEVVLRAPTIRWLSADSDTRSLNDRILPPTDVGGRATGWIAAFPDVFRRMPRTIQPTISYRCTAPAGSGWLRPRMRGVTTTFGRMIVSAAPATGRLRLELDDGSTRVVDHVLLGTGYQVDVARYPFLCPQILASLDVAGGYPRLGAGFESSIPGLHFIGAAATFSFGPIMRFVVGTSYAAPALVRHIEGGRQPLLRASF
jgi:FAD-dependent urate hydroxylase